MVDVGGAALSNTEFPSEAEFSSFGFSQFFIRFTYDGGFNVVYTQSSAAGPLSYLTLTTTPPVPEASTSAMLALGLGAIGIAARRRKIC